MKKAAFYLVLLLMPVLVSAQTEDEPIKSLRERISALQTAVQQTLQASQNVPAPMTKEVVPSAQDPTVAKLKDTVQDLQEKVAVLRQAAEAEKTPVPVAVPAKPSGDPLKIEESIKILKRQVDILRPQRVEQESLALEAEIASIIQEIAAADDPGKLETLEGQLTQSEAKLEALKTESAAILVESVQELSLKVAAEKKKEKQEQAVSVADQSAKAAATIQSRIAELTGNVEKLRKQVQETPAPVPTPTPTPSTIDTLRTTIESLQKRVKDLSAGLGLTPTPTPAPVSSGDDAQKKAAQDIGVRLKELIERVRVLQNQPY